MFFSCQIFEECDSTNFGFLDSGWNKHMTSNKSMFSSLDVSIKTKFKIGDHHLVDVQGKQTMFVLSKHNENHKSIMWMVLNII